MMVIRPLVIRPLRRELLRAMGAIDDLVDANRLNVQLLASVPAVLLFAASSRASLNLLTAWRTRGLRSLRQVRAPRAETHTRQAALAATPSLQPPPGLC